MKRNRVGRACVLVLSVIAVLGSAWILPPAMHRALHLCPMRPDGATESYAVPAFARKYGVSCSLCHLAFPVLNDVGRKFKENGYVLDRESEDKDAGLIPKQFPWAAVVRAEPFGKAKGSKPEIQPIQDIGLFFADGNVAKDFSYWAEMHMTNDNGPFTMSFERARIGYHPSKYFNVLGGFGSILEGADPYETLASPEHEIADNNVTMLLDHQESGDDMDQQYIAVAGRAGTHGLGSVHYFAGVGGGYKATDAAGVMPTGQTDAGLGQGPMNYNLRAVYDTEKGVTLGGYYRTGHVNWDSTEPGADFLGNVHEYAVDSLVEFGPLASRMAFIDQRFSTEAQPSVNTANRLGAYDEMFFSIKKDNAPWIVPMVRYEWLGTRTPGEDQAYKDYVVAGLSYFPRENVRLMAEFWDQTKNRISGRNGASDNKFSTQVALGF